MRPIGHFAPAALVELLKDAPLSQGKVAFAWRAAVGPALERAAAAKLDAGTLIIEVAGPQWAREINRSKSVILERVRSLLGDETVARLEVRINPQLSKTR